MKIPYVGFVFGAPEAGIEVLDPEGLSSIARRINVANGLEVFAKVGIALQNGGTHSRAFQQYLAEQWFPEPVLKRYKQFVIHEGPDAIGFIHPGVIRKVLKLVWAYGDELGGSAPFDSTIKTDVTRLLLTLSAGKDSSWVDPYNGTDDVWLAAALALSRSAYHPSSDHTRLLAAKDAMLLALSKDNRVMQLFGEKYPVEPWEVVGGHLLLSAFFMRGTPDYFVHLTHLRADYRRLFGLAGLTRRFGEWFMSEYSSSSGRRPVVPDAGPTEDWLQDVGFLIERPYLCLPESSVLCLDYEMARSFLSRSLFKLFNSALINENPGLYARIGVPFESFVIEFLHQAQSAAPKGSMKVVGPLKDPNELDGGIQCGRIAVLLECKTGVVRTSTKLGTDVEQLKRELRDKFVEGVSDPKGFKQLAIRTGKALADPSRFGLSRCDFVIPTLVVEDDFVAQRLVSQWCANEARPMFSSFGKRVPSLQVIHVNDLEHLAALSRVISIPDALFRLGKDGNRTRLTTAQWIWDELRGNRRVSDEELISIETHHPFLDEAQRRFRDGFLSSAAPKCESCGEHLSLDYQDESGPRWICAGCPNAPIRAATEGELEVHRLEVETAIARYVES